MKAPDSQIAVTLYNLRDYCQTESDLDRTLDKVCAIGYQAVQVSGTPLAADVIRKQLDKHNLFCCATHENLQTISGDVAPLIDRLQTLECDFTALGAPPEEYRTTVEGVARLVKIFNEQGAKLMEKGIRLGYHNHHFEFIRLPGTKKTMLETFYDDTDSRCVSAEIDVHWVTRGGGSKEDLWVFNAERIARAAAACRKPVVSAVGHEIDTSILDYVADLRAPTPSAAAELCVPDQSDVRQKIFILQQNIQKNIQNRCNLCYNRFNQLATAQLLQRQHQQLDRRGQELAIAQAAVRQAAQRHVQDARRSLQSSAAVAESLSPYAVLARGYALPEQNGTPCAVETLRPGETVTLRGARAAAECRVEAVHTLEQKTGE